MREQEKIQKNNNDIQMNKLNNKGLSLVEVIVAIMILSLVVVPTLHAITMAMTYNQKARVRQNMTVSAESIMEIFKGYDMDSLVKAFNDNAVTGIKTEGGSVSCSPNTYPPKVEPIEFKINKMKTENGSKINLVNVEVKATPSYENNDTMELANLNKDYDAIFKGNKNLDKNAHDKAIDYFKSEGTYMEDFLTLLNEKDERKRKLTESDIDFAHLKLKEKQTEYTVDEDGAGLNACISVKYVFGMVDYPYYTKKEGVELETETEPETSTEEDGDDDDDEISTDEIDYEEDFLDNYEIKEENKLNFPDTDIEMFITVSDYIDGCSVKDADAGLYEFANVKKSGVAEIPNRLFIYYFPKYNKELTYTDADGVDVYVDNIDTDAGTAGIKDKIKINSSADIDCYLIKQKPLSIDMTNIELKIYEERYSTLASVEGSSSVRLYHNFGYNLGDGSLVGKPDISSFGAKAYDFVSGDGGDASGKAQIRKDKQLVYKLEMKVYDSETGNLVSQLEGTMGEKKLNKESAPAPAPAPGGNPGE